MKTYALSWKSPATNQYVIGPPLMARHNDDIACGHTDEPMSHKQAMDVCTNANDYDWTGNVEYKLVEVNDGQLL